MARLEFTTAGSVDQPVDHPATLPPSGDLDIEYPSRAKRARREQMLVLPVTENEQATGTYTVHKASGSTYEVNLPAGTCECPDHQGGGSRCKHLRRTAMAVTETPLPAPGQATAAYYQTHVRELRGAFAMLADQVSGYVGRGRSGATQAVETYSRFVSVIDDALEAH